MWLCAIKQQSNLFILTPHPLAFDICPKKLFVLGDIFDISVKGPYSTSSRVFELGSSANWRMFGGNGPEIKGSG